MAHNRRLSCLFPYASNCRKNASGLDLPISLLVGETVSTSIVGMTYHKQPFTQDTLSCLLGLPKVITLFCLPFPLGKHGTRLSVYPSSVDIPVCRLGQSTVVCPVSACGRCYSLLPESSLFHPSSTILTSGIGTSSHFLKFFRKIVSPYCLLWAVLLT